MYDCAKNLKNINQGHFDNILDRVEVNWSYTSYEDKFGTKPITYEKSSNSFAGNNCQLYMDIHITFNPSTSLVPE